MFNIQLVPNKSDLFFAFWSPWEETLTLQVRNSPPGQYYECLEGVKTAADVKRQLLQHKVQPRSVTQPTTSHWDPYLAIIVDRKTKATLAEYKVLASDDYSARHKAALLHEVKVGQCRGEHWWYADAVSMADEVFTKARRELTAEGFSLLMY